VVSIERGEVTGTAESSGDKGSLLAVQKDVGTQIASHLLVANALSGGGTFEVTEMSIGALGYLDNLRSAARQVPGFGLDPARSRKRVDYQSSLALCDQLLKGYPRLWQARYYRSLFLFHAEDFERSLTEVEALLLQRPHDIEALLLRGNVLVASRRDTEALESFRRCTETAPDDARGWYAVGRVLASSGRKGEAIDALVRALERSPVIPEAESNLRALAATARPPGSMLEQIRPGLADLLTLFVQFWKGEESFPEELATAAVEKFPRLSTSHYAAGSSAQEEGDAAAAERSWRRCLSLRPSFAEVHRALGMLMLRQKRCAEGREHVRL
jgi:tetratricopeptide (TPR) repeat protein